MAPLGSRLPGGVWGVSVVVLNFAATYHLIFIPNWNWRGSYAAVA